MSAKRSPTPAQMFALGLVASGEYRYDPATRSGVNRTSTDGTPIIRAATLNVLFESEWITFAPLSETDLVCTEEGKAWRTRTPTPTAALAPE